MINKVQRNIYNMTAGEKAVNIVIRPVNTDNTELHVTWSGEADGGFIRGDIRIRLVDSSTIEIYKKSNYAVDVAWQVIEYR
ncbi:hypothetical protein [Paenibacillus sp. 32352]|uniref:hypothetical protein n=1 Tax=Paenibacillus sp. 32352 TaxID=1969111 RepID=UPI0009ADEB24|nr:hypothetical protein [Paenibacillus sp. 32352]